MVWRVSEPSGENFFVEGRDSSVNQLHSVGESHSRFANGHVGETEKMPGEKFPMGLFRQE